MRIRRKPFDWSTALITVLMATAALVVYLRDGWDRFVGVFLGDVHIFLDILPKMAAGCLIGVFSTLLIPREMVARLVGAESGLTGLVIATFAGVIMPGGPVTVYPVAGAFLAVGADVGGEIDFVVRRSNTRTELHNQVRGIRFERFFHLLNRFSGNS